MGLSKQRAEATLDAANEETSAIVHLGYTTFRLTDDASDAAGAAGTFAGTIVLWVTDDNWTTQKVAWKATYAADELPEYKTILTSETGIEYKLECTARTAGALTAVIESAYKPGV